MSIESYNNYLTEESALDLRVEANTILAQDPEEKKTWWYELSKSPSNIIENFILKSAHQHGLDGYLGAEWWIRSHDNIESQWYFHVDGDVGRFRQTGEYLAAPFSTVTYLCDGGQPTVVVDQHHDWLKTDGVYATGNDDWSFWSYPKMGKHICWSLPYFHGVPAGMGHIQPGDKRVTLMFNLWNSRPFEPECVEYNLSHKIKDGEVFLYPKKDTDLEFRKPHGHFTAYLEGIPTAIQFHGHHKLGDSFLVTQIRPSNLSEDQYFPKS